MTATTPCGNDGMQSIHIPGYRTVKRNPHMPWYVIVSDYGIAADAMASVTRCCHFQAPEDMTGRGLYTPRGFRSVSNLES